MYEGEWLNDKRHGFGIHRSKAIVVYEGEWIRDQKKTKEMV